MTTALCYKGRADAATYTMKKDGVAFTAEEMALVTKVEFKFNGVYYNSVDDPTLVVVDAENSQVTFYPGLIDGIDSNTSTIRDRKVEVIAYTSEKPEGFVLNTVDIKLSGDAVPA